MILLDMEMPESCFDCRFRTATGECELTGFYTSYQALTMPLSESCPIKAEIPKSSTNGDVIKAMFPNLTVKVIDTDEYTNKPKTVEISVEKGMHVLTTISADVWKGSYADRID